MAGYTQTYWNELIDKYRNGTISKDERFALEKQALDDPFLFDALEGFALYDKDEKGEKPVVSTRIFTLPRMAIAASLVFLLAAVFHFTTQNNSPQNSNEAIAMVLDGEEEKNVNPVTEPSREEASVIEDENEPQTLVMTTKNEDVPPPSRAARLAQAVKNEASHAGTIQPTESKESIAADEDATIKRSGGNNPDEQPSDLKEEGDEGEEFVSTKVGDIAVEVPAATKDAEAAPLNVYENVSEEAIDGIALDDALELKQERKKKAKANLSFEAVPVIGKKFFDEYAKERIEKRGLRQDSPQEVTIEFTIDKNGNLSEFHHIFTGCPECGPFAISILQNSGEWKTVPAGHVGKARYTFVF